MLNVKGEARLLLNGRGLAPDQKTLGRELKAARIRAGLEQAQVAEVLGVHPVTVSRWERGVQQPGDRELGLLRQLYARHGDGNGEPPAERTVREVPAVPLGLPQRVRVWLQRFLLELAEADVPDEQIESARRALTSPEMFSFYVGGQPTDYTEDEIIEGMEAFALHIRDVLRKRGFKVRGK